MDIGSNGTSFGGGEGEAAGDAEQGASERDCHCSADVLASGTCRCGILLCRTLGHRRTDHRRVRKSGNRSDTVGPESTR